MIQVQTPWRKISHYESKYCSNIYEQERGRNFMMKLWPKIYSNTLPYAHLGIPTVFLSRNERTKISLQGKFLNRIHFLSDFTTIPARFYAFNSMKENQVQHYAVRHQELENSFSPYEATRCRHFPKW